MAKGIDVSRHNGTIDWKAVKFSGKLISQKDAQFERNYAGATAQGIPIGAHLQYLPIK